MRIYNYLAANSFKMHHFALVDLFDNYCVYESSDSDEKKVFDDSQESSSDSDLDLNFDCMD